MAGSVFHLEDDSFSWEKFQREDREVLGFCKKRTEERPKLSYSYVKEGESIGTDTWEVVSGICVEDLERYARKDLRSWITMLLNDRLLRALRVLNSPMLDAGWGGGIVPVAYWDNDKLWQIAATSPQHLFWFLRLRRNLYVQDKMDELLRNNPREEEFRKVHALAMDGKSVLDSHAPAFLSSIDSIDLFRHMVPHEVRPLIAESSFLRANLIFSLYCWLRTQRQLWHLQDEDREFVDLLGGQSFIARMQIMIARCSRQGVKCLATVWRERSLRGEHGGFVKQPGLQRPRSNSIG